MPRVENCFLRVYRKRLHRPTTANLSHKCHACHAKRDGCHQVPCLPRERKAYVAKCHACHAKCRGVTGDQSGPSAPPEPAQCHKCHACHAKRTYTSPSALPATQNESICCQVPRLPRKVPRRHRRPIRSKRANRASPMP